MLAGLWLMGCGGALAATGQPDSAEPQAEDFPASELEGLQPEGSENNEQAGKSGRDHLGLLFESKDGRFRFNPWLRGQFRYSDPLQGDLLDNGQLSDPPGGEFEVRRARLKIEGHLFSPKLGFYYEHELSGDHPLLDLRLDLDPGEGFLARIGQYKVLYNRERIDSSGKQQFVERSIATYAFTLDRQIGATLMKQSLEGSAFDNWLMLGLFEGDGISPEARGGAPMAVARWQWQFLGRDLPFSQGDIKLREEAAASLSFGAAGVRGPYTRFSSSGGGQLRGYAAGGDERYTLRQYLQEFAWQYRGYSIQQEYHIKHITDHESVRDSELHGGYAQFGKAWRVDWQTLPFVWELAVRLARVDWDKTLLDRTQREYSLVGNVFFSGHDNKLSFELSKLELQETNQPGVDETRVQLQWDISF